VASIESAFHYFDEDGSGDVDAQVTSPSTTYQPLVEIFPRILGNIPVRIRLRAPPSESVAHQSNSPSEVYRERILNFKFRIVPGLVTCPPRICGSLGWPYRCESIESAFHYFDEDGSGDVDAQVTSPFITRLRASICLGFSTGFGAIYPSIRDFAVHYFDESTLRFRAPIYLGFSTGIGAIQPSILVQNA
jgi:hypothetical protein